jgi:hypothetical protein
VLTTVPVQYEIITSTFTRSHGFTDISSTTPHSRPQLIQLLNAFSPRGSSPPQTIKIRSYEQWIGVSYYSKESTTTYKMMVVLSNSDPLNWECLTPFESEHDTQKLARGDRYKLLETQPSRPSNLVRRLGSDLVASLIYSVLCGDNIIFVHQDHEERLRFIGDLLRLFPGLVMCYNTITSNCIEIDGNENITGLGQLPSKFYSHKELYLPLDTVFVDLNHNSIHGDGVKSSDLTRKLADIGWSDPNQTRKMICLLLKKIFATDDERKKQLDHEDEDLIMRIEVKLGLRSQEQDNWIMF